MEGQAAKRRRVYSLEPNKVAQATFTRNYVNYLVPALKKIKERGINSTQQNNNHCDFHNVVKYEVDKAMVFSAQGFAWSNALSVKLQRGNKVIVGSGTTENIKACGEGSSSKICDKSENVTRDFASNPKLMKRNLIGDEDEDEITKGQLKSLRRLLPGGEEMCSEQMVAELESYISCLQMQVNILQCLAETP